MKEDFKRSPDVEKKATEKYKKIKDMIAMNEATDYWDAEQKLRMKEAKVIHQKIEEKPDSSKSYEKALDLTIRELYPDIFPNTRDKVNLIEKKYKLSNYELKFVAGILEFESAGKNLSNFAHRLSSEKKKPILVVNNPTSAAFLQFGFKNWMSCFSTEKQAVDFFNELSKNSEYQQTTRELKKKLNNLKIL